MSPAVGDALIEIDDARLGPPPHTRPSRVFELTRLRADQRGFAYIQITLPMDVSYSDNYPLIIPLRICVTDSSIPIFNKVRASTRTLLETGTRGENNAAFKYERCEFDSV